MALTMSSMTSCDDRLLECMSRTERAERELGKLILHMRQFCDQVSENEGDWHVSEVIEGMREITNGD